MSRIALFDDGKNIDYTDVMLYGVYGERRYKRERWRGKSMLFRKIEEKLNDANANGTYKFTNITNLYTDEGYLLSSNKDNATSINYNNDVAMNNSCHVTSNLIAIEQNMNPTTIDVNLRPMENNRANKTRTETTTDIFSNINIKQENNKNKNDESTIEKKNKKATNSFLLDIVVYETMGSPNSNFKIAITVSKFHKCKFLNRFCQEELKNKFVFSMLKYESIIIKFMNEISTEEGKPENEIMDSYHSYYNIDFLNRLENKVDDVFSEIKINFENLNGILKDSQIDFVIFDCTKLFIERNNDDHIETTHHLYFESRFLFKLNLSFLTKKSSFLCLGMFAIMLRNFYHNRLLYFLDENENMAKYIIDFFFDENRSDVSCELIDFILTCIGFYAKKALPSIYSICEHDFFQKNLTLSCQ
ncbi:hypothetical protein COBT_000550 [Conglomerata obtusa]